VEMRINERRRYQLSGCVNGLFRVTLDATFNRDDQAISTPDCPSGRTAFFTIRSKFIPVAP